MDLSSSLKISRYLNALPLDWDGCDIQVEFGTSQNPPLVSVHDKLESYILSLPQLTCLFYDHRSGEAADYIAVFSSPDGSVQISLYHCKAAGGNPSGRRVSDVYEVAGQMLKSVAYCETTVLLTHIVHRINNERHTNPSRFVRGDLDIFRRVIDSTSNMKMTFEIYGVQPGISMAAVNEHLSDLMVYGLDYVQRGGAAKAAWLVSQ